MKSPRRATFGARYRFVEAAQNADHVAVCGERSDVDSGESRIAPITGALVFVRIGKAATGSDADINLSRVASLLADRKPRRLYGHRETMLAALAGAYEKQRRKRDKRGRA